MVDKETNKLLAELKQRQAMEKKRTQRIKEAQEKAILRKKVKDLRFKQSKFGRTVEAGKVIFGNIGKTFGKVGEGLQKLDKPAPQKKMNGKKMPMKKPMAKPMAKPQPKPMDINELIRKLPQ